MRSLRKEAGLSIRAMGEALEISGSGYNHYETRFKEKYLPVDVAESIASVLEKRGIDRGRVMRLSYPQEIAGSHHQNTGTQPVPVDIGAEPPNGSALVPVFDVSASAGYGSVNEYEPQTHSLAFPPDYLKKLTSGSPQNLAIISVKGDSMEPTLLDDDIVLLDTSKKHLGYDGLFVLLMDDVLHVKRIGRSSKAGHVSIISDNSNFPPFDREIESIEPVGKVLWYGRKV